MLKASREEYAARQAEMTARWFKGLGRQTVDVDAYVATRHAAYLDRWNEALRFVPVGSRVLDVGGGNLYENLLQRLAGHQIDYYFIDIDPSVVSGSAALAKKFGFKTENFSIGFNDELPGDDGFFDAVFSSHCIEHSIDLLKTFKELNRVLRPGGMLLMAVPFG